MNRIISIALALLLVGIFWAPTSSQTSDKITLEFSEDNPDSLVELEENEVDRDSRRSRRHRARSGDIVRFGKDIVIEEGERIHGDVVSVGGSILVRGIVEGDVAAIAGDVRIEPEGEVRGEAISIGGEVIQSGSGSISGTSVSLPDFSPWVVGIPAVTYAKGLGDVLGSLIMLGLIILVAWGLAMIAPDRTARSADHLRRSPGPSLLWGFLGFIGLLPSFLAVLIVFVFLCITIIGIPIALLLLFGYGIGIFVLMIGGYLVGASVVGKWLLNRFRPQDGVPSLTRTLIAGVIALSAPYILAEILQTSWLLGPFVSGFGGLIEGLACVVGTIVLLLGVGAVLATRGGSPERPPMTGGAGTIPPIPPIPPVPPTPPVPPAGATPPPSAPAPPTLPAAPSAGPGGPPPPTSPPPEPRAPKA